MISYDLQSSCFNYRASGIIIYKNKILLAQAEHSNYHFLPGGRINFHESSSQGMIREIKEELNL